MNMKARRTQILQAFEDVIQENNIRPLRELMHEINKKLCTRNKLSRPEELTFYFRIQRKYTVYRNKNATGTMKYCFIEVENGKERGHI